MAEFCRELFPDEDYAENAAREWFTAHPEYCLNLIEEEKAIGLLAAIIRKHAEQWAHDYSCGCM